MSWKVLLLAMMLFSSLLGYARQEDDNSFGGWHFVEISHKFDYPKVTGMLYFEHENYQYKRLDCWYLRPGIRYSVFPWLKLDLSYDYLKVPDTYGHRVVPEVTGTLKEGRLSASLRFRYLHTWKPELHTQDNELRTRLLVSYKIPDLKLMHTLLLRYSPGATPGASLVTMQPVPTMSPTICRQKYSTCSLSPKARHSIS
jgi:hypothetical protein